MQFLTIHKGEQSIIAPFFKEAEFFTRDPDFPFKAHILDFRLIQAVSLIRSYYNSSVIITETFRSCSYNRKIKGAPNSFHLLGCAVDFSLSVHSQSLFVHLNNHLSLFSKLLEIGIAGFGLSPSFIHLDTRLPEQTSVPSLFDLWYY